MNLGLAVVLWYVVGTCDTMQGNSSLASLSKPFQTFPNLSKVTLETIQSLMQLEELGSDGVEGVGALWQWRRIESRLSGFLKPLQSASCEGRVYPQINLNTMTGRVSTRNPNLQGEPTGEGEDDLQTLAVRSILAAPPGRRLLVADYAQLELRLVAHLANCSSMIEILSSGGDIHSRTAYKMFQEVKSAVDQGLVLLDESDTTPDTTRASQAPQASQASLELVKDHFPELRKKAKTLNFSLLYGKTKYSFAKDWKITEDEAQVFIDRWFQAFPEVKDWMDRAHATYRPEIGGPHAEFIIYESALHQVPPCSTMFHHVPPCFAIFGKVQETLFIFSLHLIVTIFCPMAGM